MHAANQIAPPFHHVFVDFENVHQVDVSVIGAKSVNFTLLLGAKQTKLDAGLVEKLMEHAASVQLIRLTSSGRNALDFALAYYVGRAVSVSPASFIHIISKDTGFDPLIEHLRSRHIHAQRHGSFATLPFSPTTKAATIATKVEPGRQEEPLTRVLGRDFFICTGVNHTSSAPAARSCCITAPSTCGESSSSLVSMRVTVSVS